MRISIHSGLYLTLLIILTSACALSSSGIGKNINLTNETEFLSAVLSDIQSALDNSGTSNELVRCHASEFTSDSSDVVSQLRTTNTGNIISSKVIYEKGVRIAVEIVIRSADSVPRLISVDVSLKNDRCETFEAYQIVN